MSKGTEPYDKDEGDWVCINEDEYIVNVGGKPSTALGMKDQYLVGKVLRKVGYCVEVEGGSPRQTSLYDPLSLLYVFAKLRPTAQKRDGCLGDPSAKPERIGKIIDWENVGLGESVRIKHNSDETMYNIKDLIFIQSVNRLPTTSTTSGGGRRKNTTLRKKAAVKQYLTRFQKRSGI